MTRASHQLVTSAAHSPALIGSATGLLGDGVNFPGTASFTLNFFEGGALRLDNSLGSAVLPTEWANQTQSGATSIAAPYQIRLTVLSGSSPSSGDTVGSWLNMVGGAGGARLWGLSRSTLGASIGSWFVEIRNATTLDVLSSATYAVRAAVSSP